MTRYATLLHQQPKFIMARCCLITTAVIVALLALVVLKTVNDAGALRKLTVHGTEGCVQLKSGK